MSNQDLKDRLKAVRMEIRTIESRLGAAYDLEQNGKGNGESLKIFEELTTAQREEQGLSAQINWRESDQGKAEIAAKESTAKKKAQSLDEYLAVLAEVGREADAAFDALDKVAHKINEVFPLAGDHGDAEVVRMVTNARMSFKSYTLNRISPILGVNALIAGAFEGKKFSDLLPSQPVSKVKS